MKQFFIFNFCLWSCLALFSQEKPNAQIFHLNTIESLSLKSDTVFYKEGGIKQVTFYEKSFNKIKIFNIPTFELQMQVFQYDKCGNLRNVTAISRNTGKINSCFNYNFICPIQLKHYFLTNVDCKEPWELPLITY